jgi:polyphosphate kinase 2 (PPK2 family)
MGCKVQSFKKPSEEELAHDFMWRIHHHAPRKGMIQIFNRSHYEDVLVPRVHGWIPFEQLLQSSGTLIFKFYLHISREEQQQRFAERLTMAEKKWKYQDADIKESKLWDVYMEAFEDIFKHCSEKIPWHIVPADQNWYRNYVIVKTIVDSLEKLNMQYPDLPDKILP